MAGPLGWRWVFFVAGGLGLLWCVYWAFFYRLPHEHPRITPEELELISVAHREEAGGASEAAGINAGLNISLPLEQADNPYITRELNFEFHYFFMRKFWFVYLAKAIIIFPGGFGTMDEFFEVMTLMQTEKLTKPIPIVLYGKNFWNQVLDLAAMVKYGTIGPEDLKLFFQTDTVDEAFDFITKELLEKSLGTPGGCL